MAMFDRDRRVPAPFDGNDYRKRVLAAIDGAGGPQASDPFEYYDLPLEEVEDMKDAAVGAQIDAVWAFWQKQRDHPKYRGLVTALLSAHEQLAPLLRDAGSRRQLAEDARRFRSERDQGRFADLDAAIDRLVQRFGGIPRGKLEGLRRFAAGARLDEVGTESRLARHPVLDDVAPPPPRAAVPAAVYRQVRGDLDELGQLLGAPPPASLYDLIGLPPGASTPEVRAEREVAAARNRELRPDRRRALVDDLLTAVTALLVEGDPDAYLDAVAEDVTAKLRPRVVAAVLVEDELTADDYGQLLAEAEAGGLDQDRAVRVLAALARDAGVRAPAPPPRAAPTGPPAGAARPLRDRPDRGARLEPPVPVGAGAWSRPLAEARAALKAGRVVEAERLVAQARQLADGTLPPIRALDDEVRQVLTEAQQHWRTVEQALAARRFHEAAQALERLVQVAVDLPSPRGTHVAGALAQARAGLDEAGARLAAAEALSGAARESALLEAVRLAPDHEGLLAALQSAGVAPPTKVRAARVGGGVRVSWCASPSPGTVDYKVRRGDGRPVGTTQTTALEDGLPPDGGPLPTYLVVARRAGVVSAEASSAAPSGRATPAATAAPATPPAAPPPAATTPASPPPAGPPPTDLPMIVPTLLVQPAGPRIALIFPPPPVGRAEVRRLPDGTTAPAPGTVVADPATLGEVVHAMGPGAAVDRRPTASYVGYVVLTTADATGAGAAVVGAFAAYIDLPPVTAMRVNNGVLRWDWPPGCTEVLLAWRSDQPPLNPYDPAAKTRKMTNTRYEIDGGARLPPERPLHVAVFVATRARGSLQVACEAPASARLALEPPG